MANREHLEILRSGVQDWNAWRQEHPRIRPDLRGAHLADVKLRRYDLRGVDLRGASLLAANLDGADLRRADLSECDLRYCSWNRTRLNGAKLRDARGIDEGLHRASERPEWRERIRTVPFIQAGVAVAVLAVAWAAAKQGLRTSDGAAPVLELAATLGSTGSASWTVQGVAISGGLMRIRLASMDITEEAYVDVLRVACRALEGRAVEPPVERVEILRLDGDAGWQFEPAARCASVLRAGPEHVAVAVAAASLPIKPNPNPPAAVRGGAH